MPTLDYSTEPARPVALSRVAAAFVIYGLLTVVSLVVGLAHGRIEFNSGLLGLFIGPGLLRTSRGWRTCALVLLWLSMITAPIFAFLLVAAPPLVSVNFFGLYVGTVPKLISILFIAFLFCLTVWAYRVLVDPGVRRLFGLAPA